MKNNQPKPRPSNIGEMIKRIEKREADGILSTLTDWRNGVDGGQDLSKDFSETSPRMFLKTGTIVA